MSGERELVRLRRAEVRPETQVLVGQYKDVVATVKRSNGALQPVDRYHRISSGRHAGKWSVTIMHVPPRPVRWWERMAARVAALLGVPLLAIAGLGWWLVATVGGAAALALAVAAVSFLLLLAARGFVGWGNGSRTSITQIVNYRR